MFDKLPKFIQRKVAISDDGCWLWLGALDSKGYGITAAGKVHRKAYISCVGAPPVGLVLDHLCRQRRCCNPAHMEPVSNRENILRGVGVAAANARKTACVYGHDLGDALVTAKGHRVCRECLRRRRSVARGAMREYQTKWRAANRDKCREAQARHRQKKRES